MSLRWTAETLAEYEASRARSGENITRSAPAATPKKAKRTTRKAAPRPITEANCLTAKLELPYPPSVNSYWRRVVIKGQARTLISREGRQYQARVGARVTAAGSPALGGQRRLQVSVEVCPPDRRARDLDNTLKSLLDALTTAGVWGDDSQIDRLQVERGPVCPRGRVVVHVAAMAGAQQLEL